MATMNKPTYRAILNHSPHKPTLVFVSSRRQTRLTALDLISYLTNDERERQFVRMDPQELEPLLATVKDRHLAHTLAFGIGIHHAGLAEPQVQSGAGPLLRQRTTRPPGFSGGS